LFEGRRKEEVAYLDYVSLHCHSLQVCCRRGEGYYVNNIEGGERGIQEEEEGSSSLVSLSYIVKQEDEIDISRVSCIATINMNCVFHRYNSYLDPIA
jgi:hypothetical protein